MEKVIHRYLLETYALGAVAIESIIAATFTVAEAMLVEKRLINAASSWLKRKRAIIS